ncbi:MAG TPA: Fe-S cluster assembly protein SufD, partial [Acidobacteriota bacterium]|nr:Fe-S cluster assembly protein SufD [Acidobacteriota bacterium]
MTEAVLEKNESVVTKLANLAQRETNGEPGWLVDLRSKALNQFEVKGLPDRKAENWRDTDLGKLKAMDFQSSATETDSGRFGEVERLRFASLDCPRLVFVNGRFSAELSSDEDSLDGVTLGRLAKQADANGSVRANLGRHSKWQENAFDALNLAMFEDGALIEVDSGIEVEKPIQVVFANLSNVQNGPFVVNPRVLVVAGESSKVTIVESHLGSGEGDYLSNAVTEIVTGDNARVDHYRVQLETKSAVHISSLECVQHRDSNLRTTVLTLGGGLVRNETNASLAGEGGWSELNGLYLVDEDHHVDNFTRIGHEKPHCDSREVYRGVLTDSARAVFRGRIVVSEGAQKTDSKQTNNNLLLSDRALVNTKPQLEIYADDVKCTHGATVGQLDDDAIFYLQARGISKE